MSNEKRYSVKRSLSGAQAVAPWFRSWEMARERIEYWNAHGQGGSLRIWDHSTTPPTDVTDADPEAEAEKRWWACFWDRKSGYQSKYPDRWGKERIAVEFAGGDLWQAQGIIHSATEPTIAEFAAAVKDVTGVEIPVPEENKWWWWSGKEWDPIGGSPTMHQAMLWHGESKCWVFGTRDTIDAKRDRLLAAAREAGKP